MIIGYGYDSHIFEKNRKLILAGIEIPYELGLKGHSDADVISHALIDSIFGALALGDIGSHFPDNDNKYKDISNRVNNLYDNYSSKEPHETNAMNKMMTWYGIQMKTMVDDTTSKLSELLMQGTNMGIIEGRRLLNQNQNIEPDVKDILNDFVVMQEDSVETLKKYL